MTGTDLTSGSFDWTENAGATEWQIEYGGAGFIPGTGTFMPSFTNPDTITGLTSFGFYEIYIMSVCGVGDSSSWVGPIVFNTYNDNAIHGFLSEYQLHV